MALEDFRRADGRTAVKQLIYTPEDTDETLAIAKVAGYRIVVDSYKVSSDVDTVVELTTGTTTAETITSEACEVPLNIGANGGHESDFQIMCNGANDLYVEFSAVPTNGGIKFLYHYEIL